MRSADESSALAARVMSPWRKLLIRHCECPMRLQNPWNHERLCAASVRLSTAMAEIHASMSLAVKTGRGVPASIACGRTWALAHAEEHP